MTHKLLLLTVGLLLFGAAACNQDDVPAPDAGVSRALAEHRGSSISDLRYELALRVPASRTEAVTGTVHVRFSLSDVSQPLVLDFRAPSDHVLAVQLNGDSVQYEVPPDHIVIPSRALTVGAQTVTVSFRSTDAALNRQDDLLYALFVPDRASTAFPVFEQPNLKARFTLAMTIPSAWRAISNGAKQREDGVDDLTTTLHFAETKPISTYLFTFAAGVFSTETAVRNGRTLTMYHRETDSLKLQRNREAIFDLHAASLSWLEEYTQIPYPFDEFAFLAVPAFQFGGMEHPGAIWYRAESLFLDPTASRTQELGRASLIAHETAHMWFGDLVTMRWFDDVWMKEVFANFMAAKIAGPSFPELNLRLRFFQAHHPTAYAVDRTAGANAIRQPLENLRDAGSLYGAIIYQKAPVVMQQLEELIGADVMRDGLREYLNRFRYGNATWPDLIAILDERSTEDLATWSQVWVNEPGRPRITVERRDSGLVLTQSDDMPNRALRWTQPIVIAVGTGDREVEHRVSLREASAFLPLKAQDTTTFVLAGADGVGYARFVLDAASRDHLLENVNALDNPIHRAAAWQSLWEEVLDDSMAALDFVRATTRAVEQEQDELVAQQVLGLLRGAYWRFLSDSLRTAVAPSVERALWNALDRAPTPGRKGAYFSTIVSVSLSADGVNRLERIWRRDETPRGLPLVEQQYISLAEALALRGVPNADSILDAQSTRITNPDRRARFAFVRPAFSRNFRVRDSLFQTFTNVENRRRESWVLDAMSAMHHPLRAKEAIAQVAPSLELTEEIQRTGDIFFPLRWLNATLDGHRSKEAADLVRAYLAKHPDLPPRLRGKVLQAADDLYRASTRE